MKTIIPEKDIKGPDYAFEKGKEVEVSDELAARLVNIKDKDKKPVAKYKTAVAATK